LNSDDEIRAVLHHIRLASKHELKKRITAGIEDVNRHPAIPPFTIKPEPHVV
jgi:hypothetical protein